MRQSQWRCFIFSLEGLDPDAQDFAERTAAMLPTTRKSFVHLTKDDLVNWVTDVLVSGSPQMRETAKTKAKTGNGPVLAEVCVEALLEVDSGELTGE